MSAVTCRRVVLTPLFVQFPEAPQGPLLEIGGHDDLEVGIGKNHRAGIAAIGDHAAFAAQPSLVFDERPAHPGQVGEGSHSPGHLRPAYLVADVLAAEQHGHPAARFFPGDVELSEKPLGGFVAGTDSHAHRRQGHGAVEGAGVDVAVTQDLRHGAGCRRLAGTDDPHRRRWSIPWRPRQKFLADRQPHKGFQVSYFNIPQPAGTARAAGRRRSGRQTPWRCNFLTRWPTAAHIRLI